MEDFLLFVTTPESSHRASNVIGYRPSGFCGPASSNKALHQEGIRTPIIIPVEFSYMNVMNVICNYIRLLISPIYNFTQIHPIYNILTNVLNISILS